MYIYIEGSFKLELPELESLYLERCEVRDERNFGSSLSPCPKLETIQCYKLWGLGGTVHELRLPECREISFWRSDDLEGLQLWAPKLADLELRACYSLECVRVMEDPHGSPVTPLRAPGGKLMTKERDGPCAMWFGDGDVTSGEGTDDTDDDDDDDGGFVGGVGFGFVWGPGGMMVGGNTANPGFGPMMHPLMHMMADGVDAMA